MFWFFLFAILSSLDFIVFVMGFPHLHEIDIKGLNLKYTKLYLRLPLPMPLFIYRLSYCLFQAIHSTWIFNFKCSMCSIDMSIILFQGRKYFNGLKSLSETISSEFTVVRHSVAECYLQPSWGKEALKKIIMQTKNIFFKSVMTSYKYSWLCFGSILNSNIEV